MRHSYQEFTSSYAQAARPIPVESGTNDPQKESLANTRPTSDTDGDYIRVIGDYDLFLLNGREEEVELSKAIELGLFARRLLNLHPLSPDLDDSTAAKQVLVEYGSGQEVTRAEIEQLDAIGQAAMRRFIEGNLGLVVSIAERYQGRGLPLDELIQEGTCGLIHAVEKFDHTKGFKFSTYGTRWILEALQNAVRKRGATVPVPKDLYNLDRKVGKAQCQLAQELGREPTIKETAERSEVSVDRVQAVHNIQPLKDIARLDEPLYHTDDGATTTLRDTVVDESDPADEVLKSRMREELRELLASILVSEEYQVIYWLYGLGGHEPLSSAETGKKLEKPVVRTTVRRMKKRALEKLRDSEHASLLREFMS